VAEKLFAAMQQKKLAIQEFEPMIHFMLQRSKRASSLQQTRQQDLKPATRSP